MVPINYWAVLAAAAAQMAIGMAWYNNGLFGRMWARLTRKKQGNPQKASFIIAVLAAVLMAVIMSFIATLFPRNVWGGIITGFLVWAGFVATTSINEVVWEGRSPLLFFINNGYHLLSMIVMGIVVSVWL